MKKALIIFAALAVTLFSACSRVPFRVGGIQMNQTLPTHIIYLFHDENGWDMCVRFYVVEEEKAVEHFIHGKGKSIDAALDEIEALTGHTPLYMSHCGLFLGGDAADRKDELAFFAPYLMYVYLADENVAESPVKDLSSVFYEAQVVSRKSGASGSITVEKFLQDSAAVPPRAVLNQGIIEVVED